MKLKNAKWFSEADGKTPIMVKYIIAETNNKIDNCIINFSNQKFHPIVDIEINNGRIIWALRASFYEYFKGNF